MPESGSGSGSGSGVENTGTYDASYLEPHEPTSRPWALNHARWFLRDREAPFQYSDAELYATLAASAFVVGDETYYRPHEAAALIILSDSAWALSESTLGASVTSRSPTSAASGIRKAGRWIDDLIENESGERPPSARTLAAVF